MCPYFEKHPTFASSRRPHIKFREALHQLVQALLEKKGREEKTSGFDAEEPPSVRRNASVKTRLTGKYYPSTTITLQKGRRAVYIWAYKLNPKTNKRRATKTFNYCVKCQSHVCKNCFKQFHSTLKLWKWQCKLSFIIAWNLLMFCIYYI